MEQKELNNLSAEELDAMADALLAADDAKQAEAKADGHRAGTDRGQARGSLCGGRVRSRKAGVGKDHGGKAQ